MTARPDRSAAARATRPLDALLNVLVVSLAMPVWLQLWLRLHPAAGAAVRWTLYDDLTTVAPRDRWRRAAQLLPRIPQLAAAQSAAEQNPATRTGGDPPESGPPASGRGWGGALRGVREVAFWAATLLFSLLVVVMWLNAFSTLFDLLDAHAPGLASAVGALSVMLVVATGPAALLRLRGRWAWTPASRRTAQESGGVRLGWGAALVIFTVAAFVVWLRVMGAFFDALKNGGVLITLEEALALAVIVMLAAAPLGYVIIRRHQHSGSGGEAGV